MKGVLAFLRNVRRLLVTASFVPSSPLIVTLMKEALSPPETSVLQEPHGVTSQKTPFFRGIKACIPPGVASGGSVN
jgi:hypothetical protein